MEKLRSLSIATIAPPTFESLPIEILQHTCAYLDQGTRWAVAATSRTCNAAATVHLFHTIRISIRDSDKLKADINQWKHILDRTAARQQVGRLVVQDHDSNPCSEVRTSWTAVGAVRESIQPADDLTLWDEDDPLSPRPPRRGSLLRGGDEDWLPLADFVLGLSGLRDVVYKCSDKMPKCLADALQQKSAKCSVHVLKLDECGLTAMGRAVNSLVPAIMPQLRSVSLKMTLFEAEYDLGQTCLRKILQRAPNLRDIGLYWSTRGSRFALPQMRSLQIRQTEYLSENINKIVPSTSVRTLRLEDPTDIYQVHLEFFSYHIDMTKIRVLKIDGEIINEALEWAADNCRFASLETLEIRSQEPLTHRDEDYPEDAYRSLLLFLRSLPPLQKLRIHGPLNCSLVTDIIKHHGQSLRCLWLETILSHRRISFDHDFIADIQRTCPLLEDLKIPIPRSHGSLDEVKVYQGLGTLKRLRNLWLVLNIDNPRAKANPVIPGTDFDPFDLQPLAPAPMNQPVLPNLRNGHLRNAFMNCAVDEKLARAIFEMISKNKTSDAVPLENLAVLPMNGEYFGHRVPLKGYRDVVENLSRWWLLVRDPRDTHRQEVRVKELGQTLRLSRNKQNEDLVMEECVATVFCRVWPNSREERFWWRDNWRSLPLADTT